MSCTATLASTTASRIWRASDRRSGVDAASSAARNASRKRSNRDQLLRIVFAKKSEKTGSTALERHLGHAGRDLPGCSLIVSVRAEPGRHAVQRYSYSGMM